MARRNQASSWLYSPRMKLANTFTVAAQPERAWALLLDPELVIVCMPGAELEGVVDDDTWKVAAKIKLGPVTMTFRGKVSMLERDDAAHRVVMKAKGTETRGKGMFTATITSSLEPDGSGCKVSVATELKLSGKAATFGRGMVGDVSKRLTQEFADNMESQLIAIAKMEAEAEVLGETEADSAPGANAEPDPQSEPESETQPEPAAPDTDQRDTQAEPAEPAAAAKNVDQRNQRKKKQAPRPVAKLLKPPPPKPEAVGGVGLFVWALWRAVVRFLKRVVGKDVEPS